MATCSPNQFRALAYVDDGDREGNNSNDYVPVWRVSLWRAAVWRVPVWRDSSSARFTLGRCQFGAFHFGTFPIFVSMLIQYSRQFLVSFLRRPVWRAWRIYLCACFLSAHVFCEEVLSTPVCSEATLLGVLWRTYHFLRIFPLCVVLFASYIY